MTEYPISRRDALRGIAGATITGMAGCLSSVPGVQGGGGTAYTNWLYEPGTIEDTDHYPFYVLQVEDFLEYEDELPEGTQDSIEAIVEDRFDAPDIDVDDVSQYVLTNWAHILIGSFDTEDIDDELTDRDFDDDEYEGYQVYVGPEEGVGFGVKSDVVIGSFYRDDAEDALEEVIDTKRGETDRYVDEVEELTALVDQLPSASFIRGSTFEETEETDVEYGQFEHAVASGMSYTIEGDETSLQNVYVFEEADDIDTDDIEEYYDETDETQFYSDFDDIEISTAGRAAIVNGTVDTDDLTL